MSLIKATLDEIVEAVKKQLKEFGGVYYDTPDPDSPPDANFAFVNMFEIDSDNLNLAIEAALAKFVIPSCDICNDTGYKTDWRGVKWECENGCTTPKKGGDDEG